MSLWGRLLRRAAEEECMRRRPGKRTVSAGRLAANVDHAVIAFAANRVVEELRAVPSGVRRPTAALLADFVDEYPQTAPLWRALSDLFMAVDDADTRSVDQLGKEHSGG